jgi:hypothetical protein
MLVIVPRGAGVWEIRVVNPWWQRWLRAWREARESQLLAQLDERMLRDIGMDLGNGHPLAVRAHALRQQELRRIAMAQLGLI